MAKILLSGEANPGVKRMEILAEHITRRDKIFIFVSLFFVAYVYALDGSLRYVYQPYATAGFSSHSALATVNVLRSVIAAAAQPTVAKLADVFGRMEMVIVSVVFYAVGTAIDATCHNVQSFAAGAVIYQIGYTTIILLVEVIIADITSLRSRLVLSYVPALPFLINAWVSGDISEAVLGVTTWRWGIGMWGVMYTAFAIPLVVSLWIPLRRAKKANAFAQHQSPYQQLGTRGLAVALFWQLDIVGIILLIAIFALTLVPFTIAGGTSDQVQLLKSASQWAKVQVILPLALGFLCIPIWLWWEWQAKHPLVPFRLLEDRAVWGCLGIAWMLTFCWNIQADFLYTVLIVAFDESIKSATRIAFLYSFCSVLTGVFWGFVVHFYIPRLKWFIFAGAWVFVAAFGMLIAYRGGATSSNHAGIIGAQVVLGIGGGLLPYPTQTSIQAATRHQDVAVIIGLFLAMYNIGAAFGNAVSGAIWRQYLIPSLLKNLPPPYNNITVAEDIFKSPFTFAAAHPMGTPLRDGIVISYRHTQKILSITGICLCFPLIFFVSCIRNPHLGKEQSLPNPEAYDLAQTPDQAMLRASRSL